MGQVKGVVEILLWAFRSHAMFTVVFFIVVPAVASALENEASVCEGETCLVQGKYLKDVADASIEQVEHSRRELVGKDIVEKGRASRACCEYVLGEPARPVKVQHQQVGGPIRKATIKSCPGSGFYAFLPFDVPAGTYHENSPCECAGDTALENVSLHEGPCSLELIEGQHEEQFFVTFCLVLASAAIAAQTVAVVHEVATDR